MSAPRASSLLNLKPMQTLTRMNIIVMEGYHHMTTMNENVNWMNLTHLPKLFFL